MKTATLNIDCDTEDFPAAQRIIESIIDEHGVDVLNAVKTLLIVGAIETAQPGVLQAALDARRTRH